MTHDRRSIPNARPAGDRIRRIEDVRSTWCGDDLVLFDTRHDTYYTLNRVAGRLWDLLASPKTAAELVRTVRAEFDVTPGISAGTIEREVSTLLRDLSTAGLVVAAGPNVTGQRVGRMPAAG